MKSNNGPQLGKFKIIAGEKQIRGGPLAGNNDNKKVPEHFLG